AFISYTSPLMLTIGAIVTGATYGALLALFPATTWDWYGLQHAGTNYGLIFTAWGVGVIVAPLMAGRIIGATGVYATAHIVSAILLLIAASLAFITRAPKVKNFMENETEDATKVMH